MRLNIQDFQLAAQSSLPRFVYDYVAGGAEDELCLARNQADLQALTLAPRSLRDTSALSTEIEVFGRRWSAPFGVAPVGLIDVAKLLITKDTVKMDGQAQQPYARKNWSSLILYNCAHPATRQLTPAINSPGLRRSPSLRNRSTLPAL